MVIDTSALLAILFDEPEAPAIEAVIEEDPTRVLSTASLVETSIVVEARFGDSGGRELDLLVYRAAITLAEVTVEQAEMARIAFRRFGRGRHRAGLNYGDCFSYALAMTSGEPLLFKGDDFLHTDVPRAL